MANLIGMSTTVGRLTLKDPRAKWARVELDGIDVTRGYGPQKRPIIAANDIEGWIIYLTKERLTAWVRGNVRITFAPSDEANGRTNAPSPKGPQ